MLSILSSNINILIDGMVVGQKLGINGLTALNLCMPVYLFLCVIGSFIVSGSAIMSAVYIGKNQESDGQHMYKLSIGLCIAVSVVITAGGILAQDSIASFLCSDTALLQMVKTYTTVTLVGCAAKILLYVPFWFLRLDGRNKEVTFIMVTMASLNVVLDYVFLYAFSMDVFGAALASVIASSIAAAIGFFFLCDKKSGFKFGVTLKASKQEWKDLFKNGTPQSVNNLAQTIKVLAVNNFLLSYGGNIYIAMFAAVNCICEFSLCVISGVPQAASAMLGIYHGESDNSSTRLLTKLQIKYGLISAAIFGVLAVGCSQLISSLYALNVSLYLPMICVALSVFPALLLTIFSGYYNVSEKTVWSNLIIVCRVLVFPVLSLFVLRIFNIVPWYFILLGEVLTVILWFVAMNIRYAANHALSRYLLLDDKLEKERHVLDFSVDGNVEAICLSSEKITDFCMENGLTPKKVMQLALSMEELMTMIVSVNGNKAVRFDLRLFSLYDLNGIRIRYSGMEYNPFNSKNALDNDDYMGVQMIQRMVSNVVYQRTFGMNTIRILI